MTDENNQRIQCPTPDELSILVQHMNMYFSFPERSIYRNKIAQKASESLTKISKKWTHRTVRLWFNNNRSQYNINENENVNLNRPIYSSESNIKLFLEQNEYEYLTKKNIDIFIYEYSDDEYFEDEEEEEECSEIFSTDGHEKNIQKAKDLILKGDVDIYYMNKYAEKYFSGNIELYLFVIISCAAESPLTMTCCIRLISLVLQNHSNVFLSSFSKAIYNFRLQNDRIDLNVILLVQMCFSECIIDISEGEEILSHYVNNEELQFLPPIFKYRMTFQKDRRQIVYQKKNYLLNQKVNKLERENIELKNSVNVLEKNSTLSIKDDFTSEIISNSTIPKNRHSYSDKFYDISTISYIY